MTGGITGRLYPLQSLRFVAAAAVMVGHAMMEAREHGSTAFSSAVYDLPWSSGVDVFFVISGFIIYHITRDMAGGPRPAADFTIRRLIRLVPLYWLFTALMATVILIAPGQLRERSLTVVAVLKSLFFIPYVAPAIGEMRPVLGQGWTLNYEMLFYATFAICLALTRFRLPVIAALFIGLVVLGSIVPLPPELAFYASYRLLQFVAGMALARLYLVCPRHGTAVAVVLLAVAAVVGGWVGALLGPEVQAMRNRTVMSVLAVYAVIFWRSAPEAIEQGLLPLLGDASYALYLGHPFAINAVLIVFAKARLGLGYPFVAVACLAAIASTLLLHLCIERPLMRRLTGAYKASALGRWAITRPPAEETLSMLNEFPPQMR